MGTRRQRSPYQSGIKETGPGENRHRLPGHVSDRQISIPRDRKGVIIFLRMEAKVLRKELGKTMDIGRKILGAVKKVGLLLIALSVGMSFGPANPQATAKESEVLLLHSSNVTGYLFPCPT